MVVRLIALLSAFSRFIQQNVCFQQVHLVKCFPGCFEYMRLWLDGRLLHPYTRTGPHVHGQMPERICKSALEIPLAFLFNFILRITNSFIEAQHPLAVQCLGSQTQENYRITPITMNYKDISWRLILHGDNPCNMTYQQGISKDNAITPRPWYRQPYTCMSLLTTEGVLDQGVLGQPDYTFGRTPGL